MEEAFKECMDRIARGESVEAALKGYESMASELKPMVEAALVLRSRGRGVPEFSDSASQNARARMQAERALQAERRQPAFGWLPLRAVGVVGISALAVVVALVAFATGLLDPGDDTSVAQAQGVVASSATDSVVLTTPDGQIVIRIGEDTVVLDANGNVISGNEIAPGTQATIEFEEDDDGLSGVRIEVEDAEDEGEADDDAGDAGGQGAEVEFNGVIQSMDGGTLVLSTGFGPATVRIDGGTEVKGILQVGQAVKIHATLESGGSYLAREVEAAEAGDGGGAGDSSDDGSTGNSGQVDDGSDDAGESGVGSPTAAPQSEETDDGADESAND
jgi:hypothetical protein